MIIRYRQDGTVLDIKATAKEPVVVIWVSPDGTEHQETYSIPPKSVREARASGCWLLAQTGEL